MPNPGIYPPTLPPEVLDNPRAGAERAVYERLADLEGFTVFYHCSWLDGRVADAVSDGEADFIVAHPHWGFVSLEVKGGQISRDSQTRTWKSKNRKGQIFTIKNPVEQALKSKYVVLNKVKDAWRGRPPFIRAKHGVIFPESGRPKDGRDLGADMPLEIFAFAEDMEDLGARVVQLLMHEPDGSHTNYDSFGDQGIRILHDLFDRGFDLEISLATLLKIDDNAIEQLTKQQQDFLSLTASQKRLLVGGGAGTGKTTLAVEKARRLGREGLAVLVLCYNKPLAVKLASWLTDLPTVKATSFHQLCTDMAQDAGIKLPNSSKVDRQQYFHDILPDALLDALALRAEPRFDAVIVDEGQDFLDEWWLPLSLILREEDAGLFYVFKDGNQQLYRNRVGQIPGMPEAPLHLTTNLRNTKVIFDAAKNFYSGSPLKAGGPKGKDIEWVICTAGREEKQTEKVLNKLINLEGIKPSDIAVLTACTREKSVLGGGGCIGKYETRLADEQGQDLVTKDSIYRFKGLESKVVVITDLGKIQTDVEVLYVGLSRARLLLVIVATRAEVEKLRRTVANDDASS